MQGSESSHSVHCRDIYPPDVVNADELSSDDNDSMFPSADIDHHSDKYDEPIILDATSCDDDSWGSYKSCTGEGLHFEAPPDYKEGSMALI